MDYRHYIGEKDISETIIKAKFIAIALNDSVRSLLCLKSRKTLTTPASAPRVGSKTTTKKNIGTTNRKGTENGKAIIESTVGYMVKGIKDTIKTKDNTTKKTLKNREVFLKVKVSIIKGKSGIQIQEIKKLLKERKIKIKRNQRNITTHIKARVSEIFVKSFCFKNQSTFMLTNWFSEYLYFSKGFFHGL